MSYVAEADAKGAKHRSKTRHDDLRDAKIFGDANEKYVKKLQPLVEKINSLEKTFESFSDGKLKDKTQELKERLKHTGLKLRSFETTRIIFFIILYSSVVSAFASAIPGLELIAGKLVKFGSVIGSVMYIS